LFGILTENNAQTKDNSIREANVSPIMSYPFRDDIYIALI